MTLPERDADAELPGPVEAAIDLDVYESDTSVVFSDPDEASAWLECTRHCRLPDRL